MPITVEPRVENTLNTHINRSIRNILVTGGAGFIGKHLIELLHLKHPKVNIWVYDNLNPQVHGQSPQIGPFPPLVRFIKGDISDRNTLNNVIYKASPELIYHLASETGTRQSYDEVVRYCNVNIIGTANLIEAVRRYKIKCKFVLVSSRAVYGEGGYIDSAGTEYVGLPRKPDEMRVGNYQVPMPIKAILPCRPIASHSGLSVTPASIYASTKLMQEYLLTQAADTNNVEVTILRLQNVYGPGQSFRNPYTGVLSIFCKQLSENEVISIYEDGNIVRDFIFIKDVAEVLVLVGTEMLRNGEIIDIGSGVPISILDTVRKLVHIFGKDNTAYRITGEYRIGDIRYALSDISKANKLLNWSPKIGIDEGLKRLSNWVVDSIR